MEKLNLDPEGKYLVQEEGYVGQPLIDRIYVWSPTQAAKKCMRPFDPVSQTIVSDLQEAPANTEPIELNGTTFYVNPELHTVLMDMATHIEMIESDNRTLVDEIKALKEEKEEREALPEEVSEEVKENDPAPYSIRKVTTGWYNVIDNKTDKVISDKNLRKDRALSLIEKLEKARLGQ
jgi:hypothetical protein